MKVAHVVATFPPYWAGIGNVAYHNALELARRGHDVTVLTAASPLGNYRDPPELRVRRLPAAFRFGNAPLLPHLLDLRGNDLVHLHWPFIFGAELTWLASRTRKTPYVVTFHMDLRADLRWQFGPYQALVGPLLLRGARRVFPVSLDYFRASPLYGYMRGNMRRVAEVPNGVDVEQFHPRADGEAVRRKLGLPLDGIVVGFVGAMDRAHPSRGVGGLIDAIAQVPRTDVHLLAVGAGELQADYRRRAAELGLTERVKWAGAVPHTGSDLPAHFAAMDVVVLPSLRAESFGMVLVEGMAVGKAVVGTDLPGVRRVVDQGDNGLLVPPGDTPALAAAIQQLAGDPALRARLGGAGRRKAEQRYDWRRIAALLEEQYAIALGGRC